MEGSHGDGRKWARWVWGASAVLAVARLVYSARVELAPQEAYYWQYARHLDWSYFDHPPMCAWWIALGVKLLGASELGVRLPAVVSGTLLTGVLYSLGARLYSPRVGALAALAANTTVLFGLGAVVMTPDVPLVLFWALALRVLCELVLPDGAGAGRGGWRWYALGALCGLAMLSKYTAALLPPQILLTALLSPRGRAGLRSPHPYLALLVAVAVFSPVFFWNAQHDWASFAFQTSGRAKTVHGVQPFLVGRYVGLQAVAVGPLLYLSLWLSAALLVGPALRGEPRARLLAIASLPGLLLFTAVSPLHWVKMNWVAPAYLGVVLATAARWDGGAGRRGGRLYPALALVTGGLLVVGLYLMPVWPAIPFKEKDNLVTGWRQLATHVQAQRERVTPPGAPPPLVVGWGYKTASELAFYLPDQPQTQSDPALGAPGLAYDFWWESIGRHADALVVMDERQPLRDAAERLAGHCDRVEPLPPVSVSRGERRVTTFQLWHCQGWRREG